jgi:putative salt-induced outer membrane protein YdiY
MLKSVLFILPAITLVTILSVPDAAQAEWKGGIEGGSVIRDGDSATRLRLRASLDDRPISHYLYAEWYRAASDSYELGYKPRYWLTSRLYGFGEGRLRFEDALGIERESLILGGLGAQLIATETRQVWIEAGIGYRLVAYTRVTALEDLDEEVGIVRGGASQMLSKRFRLELDADVFNSASYVQSQLELGVSMRLSQGAIKLSHRLRRVDIDGLDAVNELETGIAFTVGL